MKITRWLVVPLFGLLAGPASADQVYLDAHFNDKAIGEPIGVGGAELGEPFDVPNTITAIVRDGPMGSPSLEIQDSHEWAGHAAFGLLGDAEISEGNVVVAADLWFDSLAEGDSCTIQITESGSKTRTFAQLVFRDDASIKLDYGAGYSGGVIGFFEAGKLLRVAVQYNWVRRSFWVWLDGEWIVEDWPHDIPDRGIGGVHIGCLFDEDHDGRFYVDAISVTDFFQATPIEEHSWGRTKATFR